MIIPSIGIYVDILRRGRRARQEECGGQAKVQCECERPAVPDHGAARAERQHRRGAVEPPPGLPPDRRPAAAVPAPRRGECAHGPRGNHHNERRREREWGEREWRRRRLCSRRLALLGRLLWQLPRIGTACRPLRWGRKRRTNGCASLVGRRACACPPSGWRRRPSSPPWQRAARRPRACRASPTRPPGRPSAR